jgi:hypothetical protein
VRRRLKEICSGLCCVKTKKSSITCLHPINYEIRINKDMKRNQIIGAIVVILIVGGGAFWGGMAYAQGQTPTRGAGAAGFTRGAGGAGGSFAGRTGGAAGGGFTTGQIVSVGNGTITIQSATASSTEIVLVGSSTQVQKTVAGSMSDLTTGTQVVVTGTPNSDGSLTAQSIQIRPAGSAGFGGRPATGATQTQ